MTGLSRPMFLFLFIASVAGSIGSLILFFASTNAQEAVPNIYSWFRYFGIENPPNILSTSSADTFGFWIGLSIIVLSMALIIWKLERAEDWLRVWTWNARGVGIIPFRRLIPLSEAAQIAYEKTHGTIASKWAERQPDGPLGWYAIYLIGQGEYPIYGIKPPLRRRMKIPAREIVGRGIPRDNGDTWSAWLDENPKYEKLAILKSDLKKRIRKLKKI